MYFAILSSNQAEIHPFTTYLCYNPRHGEFTSAVDLEDTKALFKEAAKNYQELQKTKSVTLRVNQEDLIKIKAKAK